MSTMKSLLQEFQSQLLSLEDQNSAEELFASLLEDQGYRAASSDKFDLHEKAFLDPLHMNYPKTLAGERWFAHRPYVDGSNFLITLGNYIFPLDVAVTAERVNPDWHRRIVPSIGAYCAGELETGDFTLMLCGSYSHRSEKRALKQLVEEHELLRERFTQLGGAQGAEAILNFPHKENCAVYDSPKRSSRETEAYLLMGYLENN